MAAATSAMIRPNAAQPASQVRAISRFTSIMWTTSRSLNTGTWRPSASVRCTVSRSASLRR